MKTTYLTSLSTTLCPFSPHAKTPRLILSLLPPNARARIAIKTQLLPRSAASTAPASLELGFQDGKTMSWSWAPKERKAKTKVGMEGQGGEAAAAAAEAAVVERRKKRLEEAKVRDVVEEVARHFRTLARRDELAS